MGLVIKGSDTERKKDGNVNWLTAWSSKHVRFRVAFLKVKKLEFCVRNPNVWSKYIDALSLKSYM